MLTEIWPQFKVPGYLSTGDSRAPIQCNIFDLNGNDITSTDIDIWSLYTTPVLKNNKRFTFAWGNSGLFAVNGYALRQLFSGSVRGIYSDYKLDSTGFSIYWISGTIVYRYVINDISEITYNSYGDIIFIETDIKTIDISSLFNEPTFLLSVATGGSMMVITESDTDNPKPYFLIGYSRTYDSTQKLYDNHYMPDLFSGITWLNETAFNKVNDVLTKHSTNPLYLVTIRTTDSAKTYPVMNYAWQHRYTPQTSCDIGNKATIRVLALSNGGKDIINLHISLGVNNTTKTNRFGETMTPTNIFSAWYYKLPVINGYNFIGMVEQWTATSYVVSSLLQSSEGYYIAHYLSDNGPWSATKFDTPTSGSDYLMKLDGDYNGSNIIPEMPRCGRINNNIMYVGNTYYKYKANGDGFKFEKLTGVTVYNDTDISLAKQPLWHTYEFNSSGEIDIFIASTVTVVKTQMGNRVFTIPEQTDVFKRIHVSNGGNSILLPTNKHIYVFSLLGTLHTVGTYVPMIGPTIDDIYRRLAALEAIINNGDIKARSINDCLIGKETTSLFTDERFISSNMGILPVLNYEKNVNRPAHIGMEVGSYIDFHVPDHPQCNDDDSCGRIIINPNNDAQMVICTTDLRIAPLGAINDNDLVNNSLSVKR